MSGTSYQTLKSLALLLRAFKGISFEEYQGLEMPYSCLIWSGGLEWNVELELIEQEDDAITLSISAQEMEEASWTNIFARQLEVKRTLHIVQEPVTAELAISPQLQSLKKQYKDMRETYQQFLIRATYLLEDLEGSWNQAAEDQVEFEEQGMHRFNELMELTLAHRSYMQELEQNYVRLSKTSGLAPRLPSIEEEGQGQALGLKLKQFLASEMAQQSQLDATSIQQLIDIIPLKLCGDTN